MSTFDAEAFEGDATRPPVTGRWSERRRWQPNGVSRASAPVRTQLDPGTGTAFSEIEELTAEEAHLRLGVLQRAYQAEGMTSRSRRATWLRQMAAQVSAASLDLGELDSLCTGKRLDESKATAAAGADVLLYYAELIEERDVFREVPRPGQVPSGVLQAIDRLPVGLVACLLPWNYPISQACARLAMLLASGNGAVFKGSELAQPPLLALEELARAADLPEWAFSVITGGPQVGECSVTSEHVDGVCFTGGVSTGTTVAKAAIGDIKPVVLELGGKTHFTVLSDAKLDAAVDAALVAAFGFQGQACNAGSLLFIQERLLPDFLDLALARISELSIGHQLAADTQFGPMVSAPQRARVAELVADAELAGATVHAGGQVVERPGFFLEPTVLSGVPSDRPTMTEEIFGPVAICIPFDTEEEIVRRVNGSPYGLAATIFSQDSARAETLARQLRTGVVYINSHGAIPKNAPWGGFRRSGLGRLYGSDGLYAFTEARQIYAVTASA